MRIALLEDEMLELAYLKRALTSDINYLNGPVSCHEFTSGDEMLSILRRETFDLIILDWNVPGQSGDEILRWVRRNQEVRIPVIMLTSREDEASVIQAFREGVDDYIVKPFRPSELRARIRNLLRSSLENLDVKQEYLNFGSLTFDRNKQSVTTPDGAVTLTDLEFRLALTLFRNLHKTLSREYLTEKIWGILTCSPI